MIPAHILLYFSEQMLEIYSLKETEITTDTASPIVLPKITP